MGITHQNYQQITEQNIAATGVLTSAVIAPYRACLGQALCYEQNVQAVFKKLPTIQATVWHHEAVALLLRTSVERGVIDSEQLDSFIPPTLSSLNLLQQRVLDHETERLLSNCQSIVEDMKRLGLNVELDPLFQLSWSGDDLILQPDDLLHLFNFNFAKLPVPLAREFVRVARTLGLTGEVACLHETCYFHGELHYMLDEMPLEQKTQLLQLNCEDESNFLKQVKTIVGDTLFGNILDHFEEYFDFFIEDNESDIVAELTRALDDTCIEVNPMVVGITAINRQFMADYLTSLVDFVTPYQADYPLHCKTLISCVEVFALHYASDCSSELAFDADMPNLYSTMYMCYEATNAINERLYDAEQYLMESGEVPRINITHIDSELLKTLKNYQLSWLLLTAIGCVCQYQ
ncbi:hypothetical protein [Thalassotalea marina]|uniref:Uncharacterized protein n=1 Tax=Thalassotalea marina TaxID=1673741 RepID=A0A919BS49_9GAMM|nr:hypothetical protein [Thalassotalea marina]GHG07724.1 hypothetical protein GCM10017161_41750 [Thalassotalea marina]